MGGACHRAFRHAIIHPIACQAQDTAAKADVVKALEKLAQQDVALTGAIEEEEEGGDASAGSPGMLIMRSSMGGSQPFLGDVDLWAGKNSEVVMVSKSDLPGVKSIPRERIIAACRRRSMSRSERRTWRLNW